MVDMAEIEEWLDFEEDAINGDQMSFSSDLATWDWQMGGRLEPALLDPLPELYVPGELEPPFDVRDAETRDEKKKVRELTLEDVSKYFYVPITAAAKEMKTGITQLKKRCRELGIPRWPHRKFQSIRSLITNVQELVSEEGKSGESRLRRLREVLERERLAMEATPGKEMGEETKRLRQACFKAAFKKRRMNGHVAARNVSGGRSSSSTSSLFLSETGASPGSGTA